MNSDAGVIVDYLPLEVADVNLVSVGNAYGSDPGRREIQQRGRAQPSGPQHEDLSLKEFGLTLSADLRKYYVPRIPLYLFFGKVHLSLLIANVSYFVSTDLTKKNNVGPRCYVGAQRRNPKGLPYENKNR